MKASLLTIAVVCLGGIAPEVVAQGTAGADRVIESRGFTPGQVQSSPGPAVPPPGNDGLSLLLEQNQQLRTELQALRAMVEEQGFELRKLQRDALNRYTNMDQRLGALESRGAGQDTAVSVADNGVVPPDSDGQPGIADVSPEQTRAVGARSGLQNGVETDAITATGTSVAAAGLVSNPENSPLPATTRSTDNPTPGSRANGGRSLQPTVLSEQQLYQMAYESVINSDFERSVTEFDQYLGIYPQGRFTANAWYWKGQAFLYLERYGEARDAYQLILDDYPDSAKVADAMYGLGLAWQGLGDISQARRLLTQIKRRYPNTGVANLADTRLLTLD